MTTSPAEVLLVSDRLDLPLSAPRVVKLRARVILRSLEVCSECVFPETTYHLACPNSMLTPFFTVRVPPDMVSDGAHAMLFEVFPVESQEAPLTWALFPLVGISEREYRIQFSSTSPRLTVGLLPFLKSGKFSIRKYPGFIKFRIRGDFVDEKLNRNGDDIISRTGQPIADASSPESSFRIYTEVPALERMHGFHIVTCSPARALVGLAAGKNLYIYNTVTKEYGANLSCMDVVSKVEWMSDIIVYTLCDGRVGTWSTCSGRDSILDITHTVVNVLGLVASGSVLLVGEGHLSVLSPNMMVDGIVDPRFANVLSASEFENSIVVITPASILRLQGQNSGWSIIETKTPGKVRLAHGRCVVLDSGVITVIESNRTFRNLRSSGKKVSAVSVTPDERNVALGGEDGCIEIVDFTSGSPIFRSTCLFPDSVLGLSWSGVHKMLCAIGFTEPSSTLPALLLVGADELNPYMSPTLYEWTSTWINEDHPGSQHVDVQKLKRDIIKRSILTASQRS
jgi:hypothetical protein